MYVKHGVQNSCSTCTIDIELFLSSII